MPEGIFTKESIDDSKSCLLMALPLENNRIAIPLNLPQMNVRFFCKNQIVGPNMIVIMTVTSSTANMRGGLGSRSCGRSFWDWG